jgi:hypothetical protein
MCASLLRPLLFPAFLFSSWVAIGQTSTLYADGLLRVRGDDWRQTRVTVVPQFGDPFEVPLGSEQFDLDLGLESTYLVRAEHQNCAAKEVVFDLRVPPAFRSGDFHFRFEIMLEAFKAHETPYTYAKPVGAVFFDPDKADFTYTTDYERISRAPEVATLMTRMTAHVTKHPDPVDAMRGYEALFQDDPNAKPLPKAPAMTEAAKLPSTEDSAVEVDRTMQPHTPYTAKAANRDTTVTKEAPLTPEAAATTTGPGRSSPASALPIELGARPVKTAPSAPSTSPAGVQAHAMEGTTRPTTTETTAVTARTDRTSVKPVVHSTPTRASVKGDVQAMVDDSNARESRISTRFTVPRDTARVASHEFSKWPTMLIQVDRFGYADSTLELRKVTHAYGAVFYFRDGLSITERDYLAEMARHSYQTPSAKP